MVTMEFKGHDNNMPSIPLQRCRTITLCVACASLVFSARTWASGFAIQELSITGLGMANALVANPEELGAFAYNPAAMGYHEDSSITAGAIAIIPNLEVNTQTGSHNSQGDDVLGIPLFQGALKIGTDWTLGVGVTVPFGLETEWEQGTFPGFGPTEPFLAPTHSKLELFTITPTLTYRLNQYVSIAGGADYYNATDVKLNTEQVRIDGDGDATGWNLGLMLRRGDWSLGLSYHSDVTINVKGHFKAPPPFGTGSRKNAKADLHLPSRLQTGIRWKATEELAMELGLARTGWSDFDEIVVKSRPEGLPLTVSDNDWRDANGYRLGASLQLRPRTQLRFGYSYDNTPQKDDHFNARVPDNDRHLFSIGAEQTLGDGWGVEAGYMYVHFENNSFSSHTRFTGGDPNGTDAYNGKYKSHVHLFGLGLRKVFM